ncbi:hypothetical protein BG95_01405 [Thermosipho sp. 1063]|uniref:hypothetical protein n=1 Tax=unclassified Thermosipho (in: thermotogales) TaxID=2676525 RepID=UPI0009493F86|nr:MULTISPECIES: hypothetical protein [unclassified Thermosipho (in: thermotogales)]ANQ54560.1 hypothetical protein Y592_01410 [Thermosipho sp. 1070]APT72995.1 hypothetical protein BG95_01405 [Thermosipho sp. 1063]OOC45710.1 hypothetical protein XO08_01405 [Thermosipho sp. 1074]
MKLTGKILILITTLVLGSFLVLTLITNKTVSKSLIQSYDEKLTAVVKKTNFVLSKYFESIHITSYNLSVMNLEPFIRIKKVY